MKLFYLYCCCKNVVEKLSQGNLKVIKNNLANKSGSTDQLESSSTNVYIFGVDCWWHSKSYFLHGFVFQVIIEKTCVAKIRKGI